MPKIPQQITVSFTEEHIQIMEELKNITGNNMTNVVRNAIVDLHHKVMSNENDRQIAKMNAFLDVQ